MRWQRCQHRGAGNACCAVRWQRCCACTQVVVSFRGTESMADVGTDAAATLKTVVPDPATGALRTWADAGKDAKRGLNLGPFNCFFRRSIHSGFYGAYRCDSTLPHACAHACARTLMRLNQVVASRRGTLLPHRPLPRLFSHRSRWFTLYSCRPPPGHRSKRDSRQSVDGCMPATNPNPAGLRMYDDKELSRGET